MKCESMGTIGETIRSQEGKAPDGVLFSAAIVVEKHFSKKNSWTIGYRRHSRAFAKRAFIRSDPKTKVSEQFLVSCMQSGARRAGVNFPLSFPLFLVCDIYLDKCFTKKGRINLRGGDLSNIIQGVEDALTKSGVILDDSLITDMRIRKIQGPNKIVLSILQDLSCKLPDKI